MSRATSTTDGGAVAPDQGRTPLHWPPPGLERLHGAVWPVNMLLGAGAAAMVVPMLWSLSSRQPFWSPGPFGSAWWLAGTISIAGLLLVVAGLIRASQLAGVAARAARMGYDTRTIADVACDATRDAGFLMQGLRQYGDLDEGERRTLLDARIVAAFACGAALLWAPLAFTGGVMLAARGIMHAADPLWPLVLGPTALLLCIGFLARGFDVGVTSRARRNWRRTDAGTGTARREAAEWIRTRESRLASGARLSGSPAALRLSAFGFGALALALPVPVVLLAILSSVGPLITSLVSPRLTTIPARIAQTEMLQPYALPADPTISPTDAGESLQVLSWTGNYSSRQPAPTERPPVRTIAEPWVPADAPQSLLQAARLPQRVFDEHEPLTATEQDWLDRIAAHPGHAEIERIARASSADIVATRWDTEQFDGASVWSLPFYRFSSLREGAYVHVALGVLAAERGDLDTAELRFREVLSTGLLVFRDGPMLIDMLLGGVVAQIGADALRGFYESTGRDADAERLRQGLASLERAEAVAQKLRSRSTASLKSLAEIAANEDLPPGIRWESLMNAQITATCQSPSAVLFGNGADYDEWLQGVNGSLVRFPSEAALFELVGESRVLPDRQKRSPRLMHSLFRVTFGRSGAVSRCADVATAVASAY